MDQICFLIVVLYFLIAMTVIYLTVTLFTNNNGSHKSSC